MCIRDSLCPIPLANHIRSTVCLGIHLLPCIVPIVLIQGGTSQFPVHCMECCILIHSVAHIDGTLFRDILCLDALRQIVCNLPPHWLIL